MATVLFDALTPRAIEYVNLKGDVLDELDDFYSCVFGKRNYRVLVRVSVCVCVCVCVCFCTITIKRDRSINTKLEYIVVYENSLDKFDIELHQVKVKVTVGIQKFSPFTTIQTVRSYSSTLVQAT